jgi:hypothetical protein
MTLREFIRTAEWSHHTTVEFGGNPFYAVAIHQKQFIRAPWACTILFTTDYYGSMGQWPTYQWAVHTVNEPPDRIRFTIADSVASGQLRALKLLRVLLYGGSHHESSRRTFPILLYQGSH